MAVPSSAGGSRLDRSVDVAQAALTAVAMLAGRPLRDAEHLGGLGDVLMAISVPSPIRSWLLKALHMDPRRVFVHAGDASQALTEAMGEAALRACPRDLELQESRWSKGVSPMPVSPKPIAALPAKTVILPRPATVPRAPKRDVWEAPDVDPQVYVPRREAIERAQRPMSAALKKFLLAAAIIGLMAGAFTAAQFIPIPEWMFAQNGILIVEPGTAGKG